VRVRVPTLPPIQGVDTCGDSATCASNAAVKNGATIPATPEILAEVPVRSNNSCGAAIALQQTSEPVATLNGAAALFGFVASLWEKQLHDGD